jgi:hypothetical protein
MTSIASKPRGELVNVLYHIRVTDEAKEAAEVHKLQDQTLALSAWKSGARKSIQKVPANPPKKIAAVNAAYDEACKERRI